MEQQKKKKRAVAFGLVAVVLIFWNLMQNTADQQKLRVACVGDELTFGTDVEDREDNCYPVQLQKYMEKAEKKYRIGNFGVEGAAVQKKSKKPYIYTWRSISRWGMSAHAAPRAIIQLFMI